MKIHENIKIYVKSRQKFSRNQRLIINDISTYKDIYEDMYQKYDD